MLLPLHMDLRLQENQILLHVNSKGTDWPVQSDQPQEHEISNNVVCSTSKGSDQPAHLLVA